jgi:hypothetical protein
LINLRRGFSPGRFRLRSIQALVDELRRHPELGEQTLQVQTLGRQEQALTRRIINRQER